jgi:hypothetical protein
MGNISIKELGLSKKRQIKEKEKEVHLLQHAWLNSSFYKLENGEIWPINGGLKFNTIYKPIL